VPDRPWGRVRVGSGLHLMVRAHALCDDCSVMTTTSSPAAAPASARDVRRVYRDSQEPVIGGVAGGLARHLAVPVIWVRVAFIVAAVLGGLGIAMYAALWLVLPTDSHFEAGAPGLESATRGGRRPGRIRRLGDVGPAIALAALGLGAVFLLEAVLGRGLVFWPIFLGLVGIALLWRQADEAQRERWLDTTGRVDPVRAVLGRGGWAAYARLAAGILLIVSAFVVFALRGGSLEMARDVTIAALLTVAGLAIVVGPWIYRLASDLTAERAERVRTQERADLAAHLHDSVLQTLALIQKNSADGSTVARLARAQERDLRSWLYAGEATDESTVASALRGVAAAVEDSHGVSVDVVNVGDCSLLESLRPVVNATREAVTNAAKHAGTGQIDVYAEVSPAAVDVFVRDRGRGFDLDQVAEDRHGLRHSILDRMERHGGTATVQSTPGEGTEVRLHLPRQEDSHG
jgi:signal transduction histidine kinase/phage shock protein PspC (stress-responsive transcriptional regulator)